MNKQPSLSIVIPAYNEADNLASCLDAIARQTVAPSKVVVVDNNSTDTTTAIARQYKFVTVITERRQGIAYAYSAGFNHATTDLIARIDAETILPPGWVSQVLAFYDTHQLTTALVGSGYLYNLRTPRLSGAVIDAHFRTTRALLGHYPLWGPNFVLPRSAWLKVKDSLHFEADIFDDLDLALHLHAAKYPITWDRSLRVGAQLRHCDSAVGLWHYVCRWPQTLKLHNDARWRVALFSLAVAFPFYYGLLRLLEK